jgi:hypothetical protein
MKRKIKTYRNQNKHKIDLGTSSSCEDYLFQTKSDQSTQTDSKVERQMNWNLMHNFVLFFMFCLAGIFIELFCEFIYNKSKKRFC